MRIHVSFVFIVLLFFAVTESGEKNEIKAQIELRYFPSVLVQLLAPVVECVLAFS